jgi:hypothetical protein
MQNVAEMTDPLRESVGNADRGSVSDRESCLLWLLVKLIRRRIS